MNRKTVFPQSSTSFLLAITASVICASATVVADAAEGEEKLISLDKVVSTGTRTPKLLVDSPVAVEVVEGEKLRKASQTTVARALDLLPGVVVKRSTKDGYNVYMQGFDGDRVLVLVDGRRMIAPTGAAVDLDQISVANVERIEIVRGAGSVLYGSSAMGGVINIITRQDAGNHLSLNSEVSSYLGNEIEGDELSYQNRVEASAKNGVWRTRLNLQNIDDAGFDYQPETVAQTAASVNKTFGQFSLGRDFSSFSGDYRAQIFDEEKYRDSFKLPGRANVIYYMSDVEQVQQDLELRDRPVTEEDRKQAGSWKINARYTTHDETSGDSNGLRDTEIRLGEIDSQKAWLGKHYEVVGGLSARSDSLNQTKGDVAEVDDESSKGYEGFMQYNRLAKDYEWLGGVRVQHDSDFDWHSAVRVSGMKKFDGSGDSQWHWRGGLGQSYRVPTLKERFYVFDHSNLGYMVLGNPDLQPETALSGNTSLSWLLPLDEDAGLLENEFNVHYSAAKNLLETLRDDAASIAQQMDIFRYTNFAEAKIYGADIGSKYQYDNWSLQLNYSYLYAENKLTGDRLPNRPRHQIKANVGHNFPQYELDSLLYFVYEADEYSGTPGKPVASDSYLSVNFNLSQNLTRYFSWRAGVDNIFDEHQDPQAVNAGEFDQRAVSSRRIFAGITLNFF
ncbi:MAG TPA: TonB-dependent receptor [Cellvibrio sp.]|nr:TonB-dependent receptor [Cellvibrio sp.]